MEYQGTDISGELLAFVHGGALGSDRRVQNDNLTSIISK
jgi:hypothetical protein